MQHETGARTIPLLAGQGLPVLKGVNHAYSDGQIKVHAPIPAQPNYRAKREQDMRKRPHDQRVKYRQCTERQKSLKYISFKRSLQKVNFRFSASLKYTTLFHFLFCELCGKGEDMQMKSEQHGYLKRELRRQI